MPGVAIRLVRNNCACALVQMTGRIPERGLSTQAAACKTEVGETTAQKNTSRCEVLNDSRFRSFKPIPPAYICTLQHQIHDAARDLSITQATSGRVPARAGRSNAPKDSEFQELGGYYLYINLFVSSTEKSWVTCGYYVVNGLELRVIASQIPSNSSMWYRTTFKFFTWHQKSAYRVSTRFPPLISPTVAGPAMEYATSAGTISLLALQAISFDAALFQGIMCLSVPLCFSPKIAFCRHWPPVQPPHSKNSYVALPPAYLPTGPRIPQNAFIV
ncbi:hypothetical protein R3P38DRAFT_3367414 [Favolaschia claudopus]|uniref:Uncharacterized protein n=1 Tax=Favolaschia claudopus TaxID=2862362 RepID=A0AAW0ABL5_9AGAR